MQKRIENLEKKILEKEAASKVENRSSSPAPQTHQRYAGRKRFYKQVGVDQAPTGEFRVLLDGRVLKTPSRNPLYLPNREIAMMIAAEWDAQTDARKGIEPVSMPIMTLMSTAIDQIQFNDNDSSEKTQREIVIDNCMKYLPTDSLLFFTNDMDRILLKKQRKFLTPIIKSLNRHLSLQVSSTTDITNKVQHTPETIDNVRGILSRMDHFTLACVQALTMECKSVLLALAYFANLITTEQLIVSSRIEEEFQVEIWGVVEGGHDMDRLNHSVASHSAAVVLNILYIDNEAKRKEILGVNSISSARSEERLSN